mgnify:CR=1 FL=1
MPLEKNFDNVVIPEENGKKQFTKLTELEEGDKRTIYNLIFVEPKAEGV